MNLESLESRVLLSLAQAIEPVALGLSPLQVAFDATPQAGTTSAQPRHAKVVAAEPVRQVIAVDAALASQGILPSTTGADTRVILLQPGRDAIGQITDALAGLSGVRAVHILTHGQAGALDVEGQRIDAATLSADSAELSRWSASLAPGAVVALYGCDVAKGAAGRAFVKAFARHTGETVAASTDDTGAAHLGGDWTLEYVAGKHAADLHALDPTNFDGLLTAATPTLTTSAGTTAHVVGLGATVVDAGLTLTDSDGSYTLTTATAQITGGYKSGEDVLDLPSPPAGYSSSFNASTGTLTVTASAAQTPAQFQAALRLVTYRDTQSPYATLGQRQITFSAGGASSNTKAVQPDLPVDAAAQKQIEDALTAVQTVGQKIGALSTTPGLNDTTDIPFTNSTVTDLLYPNQADLDSSGNPVHNYSASIQPTGIGGFLSLATAATNYFTSAGTITDLTGLTTALQTALTTLTAGNSSNINVAATFNKPAATDARSINLVVTLSTIKGTALPMVLDVLQRDLGLTLPSNPTVTTGGGADIQFTIAIDLAGHQYGGAANSLAANKTTLTFNRLNALAGYAFSGLNTTAEVGAIRGSVVNGSGTVGATYPVTFTAGGASRTLDLWQADSTLVSGFGSLAGSATLTFPLSASLGGVSATTANTKVVVSEPALFAGKDPTYATTDFSGLAAFKSITPEDIIQQILKVGGLYTDLSASDSNLLGVNVPMLKDTSIGGLLDLGTLFQSKIGSQVDIYQPVLNTVGRDALTDYRLPLSDDTTPKPAVYSDLRSGFSFGLVVNNVWPVHTITVAADHTRQTLDDLVSALNTALTAAGVDVAASNVSNKLTLKATDVSVQTFAVVPVASPAGMLSPTAPPSDLSTLPLNTSEYYTITGTTTGTVKGTDFYTLDTPLGAAAVHAGLLTAGQTGVVKVTREANVGSLPGENRNGITSADDSGSSVYLIESAQTDLQRLGLATYGSPLTVLDPVNGGSVKATLPLLANLAGAAQIVINNGSHNYTVNVPDNGNSSLTNTLADIQAALVSAGISPSDLSAQLVDGSNNALSGTPQNGTLYYLSLYTPTGSTWTNFTLAPTSDAAAYKVVPLGFLSGDLSSQPRPDNLRTFQDFASSTLFPNLTITPVYDATHNTVTLQFSAAGTSTPTKAASFDFALTPLGQLTPSNSSLSFTPSVSSQLAFGLQFNLGPSAPVELDANPTLPASGQIAGDAHFSLDLALQDTYAVTVPQSWTTGNASVQDLIGDVNQALKQTTDSTGHTVDLTADRLVARRLQSNNQLELTTASPANGGTAITVGDSHGKVASDTTVSFTYNGQTYSLKLTAANTAANTTYGDLVAQLNTALASATDANGNVVSLNSKVFFTTISDSSGHSAQQVYAFSTAPAGSAWPSTVTLAAARTDPAVTALGFDDSSTDPTSTVTASASGVSATVENVAGQPFAGGTVSLAAPSFAGSIPYGFNTLNFTGVSGAAVSAKVGLSLNSNSDGVAEDLSASPDATFDRTLTGSNGSGLAHAGLTLTGITAASGAIIDPSASLPISIPDLTQANTVVAEPLGQPTPLPELNTVANNGTLDADATINFLQNGAMYSVTVTRAAAAGNHTFAALAAEFDAALASATKTVGSTITANFNAGGLFTITPATDANGVSQLQVNANTTTANPNYAQATFAPNLAAFGEIGVQGAFGLSTVADAIQNVLPALDNLESNVDLFSKFKLPLVNSKLADLINLKGDLLSKVSALRTMTASSPAQIAPALASALGVPASDVRVTFDSANKAYRIDFQYQTGAAKTQPLSITLADYYKLAGGELPKGLGTLVDSGSNSPLTITIKATLNLSIGIDLTDPNNPRTFLYAHDGTAGRALSDGTSIDVQVSASADDINFSSSIGALGVFIRGGSASLGGPVQTDSDGNPVYTFDDSTNELSFVRASAPAVLDVTLPDPNGTNNGKYYLTPAAGEGDAMDATNYATAFTGSAEANLPMFTPTEFANPFQNRSETVTVLANGHTHSQTVTPGGNVFNLSIPDLQAYATDALTAADLQTQINSVSTGGTGTLTSAQQAQVSSLQTQLDAIPGDGAVTIFTPDVESADAGLAKPTVLDLFRDPSVLLDGLDTVLGSVQTGLAGLDSLNIPVIGPALGDAVKGVFGWRTGWLQDLKHQLRGAGDAVFDSLKDEIYKFLGPSGLNILLKDNGIQSVDGMQQATSADDVELQFLDADGNPITGPGNYGAESVQIKVRLGQVLVDTGKEISFNFDSLKPALSLGINGGLTFKLGWDVTLGFGISLKDGFYITTNSDPSTDDMELRFEAGLSGPDSSFTVAARAGSPTGYSIKDADGNWVLGPPDGNGNQDILNVVPVHEDGSDASASDATDALAVTNDCPTSPTPTDSGPADPVYWVVAEPDSNSNWVPAYLDKLGHYQAMSGSAWQSVNANGDSDVNPDQMVQYNQTAPFTAFGSLFAFHLTAVDQIQTGLQPKGDADYFYDPSISTVTSDGRNDPNGVNRNNSLPTRISGKIGIKLMDPSAKAAGYVARPGATISGFEVMDGSDPVTGGQPVLDDSGEPIPAEYVDGGWVTLKLADDNADPEELSSWVPDHPITEDDSPNRITWAEIREAGTGLFKFDLIADAVVNLNLTLSVSDNAAVPRLTASLNLDWQHDFAPDNGSDASSGGGEVESGGEGGGSGESGGSESGGGEGGSESKTDWLPEVGVNNIRLDLGSFLSNVIKPIAQKADDAFKPLDPLLNVINARIPVISDIAGHTVDLSTLLTDFGGGDGEAVAAVIDLVTDVRQLAGVMAAVPDDANVYLPIGNFWLAKVGAGPFGQPGEGEQIYYDNSEIKAPSITQRNQSLVADPGAGANAVTNALGSLDSVSDDGGGGGGNSFDGGGFHFPILEDPMTIFKLIMGQDEPLVTFSLPKLNVNFNTDIPLIKIFCLEVGLRINIHIQGQLDFGYDTYGIREFATSHDPKDLLDGFYISTRANADGTGAPVDALSMDATLGLYGGVDLYLAKAGVEGGFHFSGTIDLNDPNNDGKLRLPEMIDLVDQTGNPLDLADINLEGDVYARYYYWVGLKIWTPWKTYEITVVSGGDTFASATVFDLHREGSDGAPILGTLTTTQDSAGNDQPNTLLLNMGPNADKRVSNQDPLNAADGSERFKVWNDGPGSGTVHVEYLNYDDSSGSPYVQTFTNVSRVVGYTGSGDNTIDASGLNGLPVDFEGDNGNDTISLGSGSTTVASTLQGSTGDDHISVSGGGKVNIIAGSGNDVIALGSGAAADTLLTLGEGNDTVTGGGGGSSNRIITKGAFAKDSVTLDPTAAVNSLSFVNSDAPVTADITGSTGKVTAGGKSEVDFNADGLTQLVGSQGDDTFNVTDPTTRAANGGEGLVLQGGYGNDQYNVTADDTSGMSADGITIDDGTPPTAAATIGAVTLCPDCGAVEDVKIANGGSGYLEAPDVVITDPTGSGARAVASLDDSGAVTGIVILAGGQGYTDPTITLVQPQDLENKLTYSSQTSGTVTLDHSGNGGTDYELKDAAGKAVKWVGWNQPGTVRPADYNTSEIDSVDAELPNGTLQQSAPVDVLDTMTVNAKQFNQGAPITADTVNLTTANGLAVNQSIDTTNNGDVLLRTTAQGLANYTSALAAATATVVNGQVTGITVTNPGAYYDFAPTVTLTDSHGHYATAVATVSNGQVTGITVLDGGTGYLSSPAPTVVIAPPSSIQFNADVTSSTVGSDPGNGDGRGTITLRSELGAIDNSGDVAFPTASQIQWQDGDYKYTGLTTLDDITPSAYAGVAGGSGATAHAVLDSDGRVTAVVLDNPGSGYSKDLLPSVQIDGAATATAIVNNAGQVTGFHVTYPGEGYAIPPTVKVVSNGFGKIVGTNSASTTLDRTHIASAGGSLVASAYYGIGDPSKPLKTDVQNMVAQTFAQAAGINVLEKDGVNIGQMQQINGFNTLNGNQNLTTFGGTISLGQPVQKTDASGNLIWQDADKTVPVYQTDDAGNIIYKGGQLSAGTGTIKLTADNVEVNNYVSAQGGTLILQPVNPNAPIGLNGTQATATAVLTNGQISGFTDLWNGRGYTAEPLVTIAPPGQRAFATADVSAGEVIAVKVTTGGDHYDPAHPPVVTFTGGGQNGGAPARAATATALVGSDGSLTGITVTDGGSGYYTDPTVNVALPGVQATARAVVNTTTGRITGLTILNPGSNYTTPPAVTIGTPFPFTLNSKEVAYFQNGFQDVIVGRADGRHVFQAADASFHDGLTLRNPLGGAIEAEQLSSSNGPLAIDGSGHSTHLSSAAPSISGTDVEINDNVIVDDGVDGQITATTGHLSVFGSGLGKIDGTAGSTTDDLTLTAVNDITVGGAIGSTTPIHNLTINSTGGGNVSLQQGVNITGTLHVVAGTNLTIGGTVAISGDLVVDQGASVSFAGAVSVGGNLTIANATGVTFAQNVSVGGNLSIGSAGNPLAVDTVTFSPTARLDVAGTVSIFTTDDIVFGNRVGQTLHPTAITLASLDGDINFQNTVNAGSTGTITVYEAHDLTFGVDLTAGSLTSTATGQTHFAGSTTLGSMTVTSADLIQVAGRLKLTGTGGAVLTTDSITFSGGNGSITNVGDPNSSFLIKPYTTSRDLTVGSPPGVFTSLDISDADLAAISGGFAQLILGDANFGSGNVTVGSIGSQQGQGNSQLFNPTSIYGGTVNVVQGVDSASAGPTGFLRLVARTGGLSVNAPINATPSERSAFLELQSTTGGVQINSPIYAGSEIHLLAGTAIANGPNGFVNTPALRITSGGTVSLTHSANVAGTVALDSTAAGTGTGAAVTFRDDNGFAIGTVNGVSGWNSGTADSTLVSNGGSVTQTQPITAAGLSLQGVGTTFTLNNASNDIATLAANAAGLTYRDANAVTVGSVGGTVGVRLTGPLNVVAGGAIAVSQPITTTSNGTVTLTANGGPLTVGTAGTINSDGAVTMTAASGIATAASVTTTDDAVLYNSPTTLTGPVTVTSGNGNVTFASSLDGPSSLTVLTTGGNVNFNSNVGPNTRLAALTVTTTTGVVTFAVNVSVAGNESITAPTIHVGYTQDAIGSLTLAGTVDLQTDTRLSTASANGVLTITNVTGNNHNLTLASGGGATTVTGNATGINALTLQDDTAASTGTMSFQGNLSANSLATVGRPYAVRFTGLTTHFVAPVAFLNTGPLTLGGSGSDLLTFVGGLSASGNASNPSVTTLGGAIVAFGNPARFGAVNLSADTTIDTTNAGVSPAGAPVTFDGTVDGAQSLGITAGSGDVTFNAAMGGTTPLGQVTITSARNLTTAAAVHSAGLRQVAGSGSSTFNSLSTSAAAGVDVTGTAVNFTAPVATTGHGTVSVHNAGTLTVAPGANMALDGAFHQYGPGSVLTAGNITTTADPITFDGPAALNGDITLTTAGGNVTFNNTLDSAPATTHNLTVDAAAGDVTFNGTVGTTTRLGTVTIATAHNATINAAFDAQALAQTTGTGTTTLNAAVDTSNAPGVNVTTGTVALTSAGSLTTHGAPVTLAAQLGAVTLADDATIQTAAGAVNLTSQAANVSLGKDTDIDSGAAPLSLAAHAGGISLDTGAQLHTFAANPITLDAAAGLISFGANDVVQSDGGTLTVTAHHGDVTTAAGADVDSQDGNATFSAPLGAITMAAGSSIASGAGTLALTSQGDQTLSQLTTTNATAGALALTSTAGGIVNAGDAMLSANSAGAVTTIRTAAGIGAASAIHTALDTLDANATPGGPVNLLEQDAITLRQLATGTGDLNLTAGGAIDAQRVSTGNGNVSLRSTAGDVTTGILSASGSVNVNAQAGSILDDSLTAADGLSGAAIHLTASAGVGVSNNRLNVSAPHITADILDPNNGNRPSAGDVWLSSNYSAGPTTADSLTTAAGTLDVQHAGSNLTVTTANDGNGPIHVAVAGHALTATTATAAGPITLSTTGGDLTADTVTTTGGNDVTLTTTNSGDILVNHVTATAATIHANAAGSIREMGSDPLSDLTASRLDLTAGGGIGVNTDGSAAPIETNAQFLTAAAHGGAIHLSNTGDLEVDALTSSGDIDLAATGTLHLHTGAASLASNGDGSAHNIAFHASVALDTPITITTGGGGLTFDNDVAGGGTPQPLTIDAGTGPVTFSGDAGTAAAPLAGLTLTHAGAVTFAHDVNAGSGGLTVNSTDHVDFDGNSTVGGNATITVTTPAPHAGNVNLNGNFTTTDGGNLTVTHDGTFTVKSGVTLDISGNSDYAGTGTVSFGTVTYNTHSTDVVFDQGPVVLTSDTVIDTGTGAGNIIFKQDVSGAHDLVIHAHGGTVVFEKAVGDNGAPLANLTIDGAAGVVFMQPVNVAGDVNLTSTGGVTFGDSVTAGGNLNVTAGGAMAASGAITVAGTTTMNVTGDTTLNGPVQGTGAVSITTGGALIANGLSSADALTLHSTGDATLNGTTSAIGDAMVTVGGSLTDNGTLTAGGTATVHATHDATLQAAVQANHLSLTAGGSLTAYGNVTSTADTTLNVGGTADLKAALQAGTALSVSTSGPLTTEGAVTAGGDATFHVTGNANFQQGASATGNLTLTATGGVTLGDDTTAGGNLSATAGGTLAANGVVTAGGSLTLSATGDADLHHLQAGTTLSLTTGGDADVQDAVQAGGGIQITHTGTLHLATTATVSAGGAFVENGPGAVLLDGQTITTGTAGHGGASFAGAVTLGGDVTVDTTAGPDGITFGNTVDAATAGGAGLSLATAGDVHFANAVGATVPLAAVVIQGGHAVAFDSSVSAGHLAQTGGTGTTTLNGNVASSDAQGVAIQSTGARIGGQISTQVGAPVTFNAGPGDVRVLSTGGVSGGTVTLSGGSFELEIGGTLNAAGGDNLIITADTVDLHATPTVVSPRPGSAKPTATPLTAHQLHLLRTHQATAITPAAVTAAAPATPTAALNGTGLLILQPASDSRRIDIGASGPGFDLTTAELSTIGVGFSAVLIGRGHDQGFDSGDEGANPVVIHDANFANDVIVRDPAAGGSITVSGNLTTSGKHNGISLLSGGDVRVDGSVNAQVSGDVTLAADLEQGGQGALHIAENSAASVKAANGQIILTGADVHIGSATTAGLVTSPAGAVDIRTTTDEGAIYITNDATTLISGDEMRVGDGIGGDIPTDRAGHVSLSGNVIAGGNIRIESYGDIALSHTRQRANGFLKVIANSDVIANDAAFIAQGGAVTLWNDADGDGHGKLTTANVRVSQLPATGVPLDLGASLHNVVLPAISQAGDTGTAYVVVNNRMAGPVSGPVTLVIYASADGTLNASDRVIGLSNQTVKLAVGGAKTLNLPVQIPAGLAPGKYHLVAELLPYRPASVATRGTADPNVSVGSGTYVVQQPLLGGSVTSTLDGKATSAGLTGKATATVVNAGGVRAAGKLSVTFYASANGSLKGAIPIGSVSGKSVSLLPGQSQALSATVAIPASLAGGTYHVIAALSGTGGLATVNTVNGELKDGGMFRVGAGGAKKKAA